MTPNTLIEHFNRISESPDSIPRLRRFILDLAVRGKLVEQDPNDEPASELLKRIQKEKMRLVKDVKTSKNQTLQITNLSDVPFNMPYQWEYIRLISIGKTQTGTTPPSNSPELFGDYIPFVKPADLNGNMINYSGDGISEEGIKYSRLVQKNSVMMVCIGSSIGKVNINYRDVCCNQQINTLTPYIGNITNYIAISLKSTYFQNLVIANAGMGTLPILSKGKWETLPILLPPLQEQHRIVAKVDELMALCDQLETAKNERESRRNKLVASSLNRIVNSEGEESRDAAQFHLNYLPKLTANKDHIKQLRQSILNLAVRGKLVEQDPNDEPASELLNRIQNKCSSSLKTKEVKNSIKYSQIPFNLPSGWLWSRFQELGIFGRGKSKHRPRNDVILFDGGSHLVIQTGDVARSQGEIKTYTNKYNDIGLAQSKIWPAGTLCITIAANIADSGILSFEACFPDSVVGFIPATIFENARYFEYFMRTAKSNILDFAPATAQKNINLEILNAVLIPLPPLAEQHRIVAKVDELMAICDKLESQLTTSESDSRRLCEAVLRDVLN